MKRTSTELTAVIALMICGVAILFSSCTSSRLTTVWRDPSYNLGPMKSMIVISVDKDPVKRRVWEDAFTLELSKYDDTATQSYRLFPDNLPDTALISLAMHVNGIDGILIISRLPTQTQKTAVAPYVTAEPVTHYDEWRGRYHTRYVEEYHPGYVETSKIVNHQVDIWSMKKGTQMVWSGTCATADPVSSEQVHDETVGLIAPMLVTAGIITPRH